MNNPNLIPFSSRAERLGYRRGRDDAEKYRTKNPNRLLPWYRTPGFVTQYAQDYIRSYNNGYFAVLKERKLAKEKLEAQKQQEKELSAEEIDNRIAALKAEKKALAKARKATQKEK